MADLLPCPFCGKTETLGVYTWADIEDNFDSASDYDKTHYAVCCDVVKDGCGAVNGGDYETPDEAVEGWNWRTNEMMDKKDAIDYLLYMKHDVLANSPYDVALDTAIEALKETAKKPKTNGDRIRLMTDEELAEMVSMKVCRIVKPDGSDCPKGFYFGMCDKCVISWLKQEVRENGKD